MKCVKWSIGNIFLQLCSSLELSLASGRKAIKIKSNIQFETLKRDPVYSMQEFAVVWLLDT